MIEFLIESGPMLAMLLFRSIRILLFAAAVIAFPRWLLSLHYSQRIADLDNAPSSPNAVVFGAGLNRRGQPTSVLVDRVRTAAELYHEGKVERLFMSGSIDRNMNNEALAMRDLAVEFGVPSADIIVDSEGDRTLATCINARNIHSLDSAVLVTQRYHLPRALVLCQALGMEVSGVSADLREYRPISFWVMRETFATLRAVFEVGQIWFNRV